MTRLYVSNLIKEILKFYDNSNFVFFFNFSKEKKLDFTNCHSVLFPAFAPRFPAFPPPFPTFPAFSLSFLTFPSRFPAFPPLFPAFPPPFPAFPSFRSPIPHSGFYRYPERSNIFIQYPLNNIRVSDVYFK